LRWGGLGEREYGASRARCLLGGGRGAVEAGCWSGDKAGTALLRWLLLGEVGLLHWGRR
jgi:hypothetical protein